LIGRPAFAALLAAGTVLAADPPAPDASRPAEQYFTEREARDRVYGPGLIWRDTVCQADSVARKQLYDETGLLESDSLVRLSYGADSAGTAVGSYRVASEIGKYLPFEFLVALDADGKVLNVVVLNYREARGGEVRRERFLQQYRGKSASSPVRLNRDILGIAGATLSAWAVNRGVKKTLWWCDRIGPQGLMR
jgi:hypothetical protein